jgi:hypothetical protein
MGAERHMTDHILFAHLGSTKETEEKAGVTRLVQVLQTFFETASIQVPKPGVVTFEPPLQSYRAASSDQ